ncbi:DMT family transporter [Aquibaculum arenosum]|uniref:EamA family transporter n=1 Tax=Aquibaculum arenosum TaxID=3032591 RepID=A0ABT5YJP6_9PROT|nr:EamA family transporter [Fodinicurvata sp. CAU 1616]MDF2095166.1 EamA family transporter [Fodinicurvata sp. CAU 1616]
MTRPSETRPRRPLPIQGPLLLAAAVLLWGTAGVASKAVNGIEPVSPVSIVFYRLLFCLPLLLVYGWTRYGARLLAVRREHWLAVFVLALTTACYQVFYFAAVQEAGVTLATFVSLGGAPFLVALLAALVLKERPSRGVLIALLLAVPGALLLVGLPRQELADGDPLLGTLLASCAAFSYAAFALQSRVVANSYDPVQLVLLAFGGALILVLPLALHQGLAVPSSLAAWGLLIYIGLLPTAAAYLLFFAGLREASATLAGLLTVLEPLAAAVLAWLLFGERLGLAGLLGAGLILLALVISSLGGRRSRTA